MSTRLKPHKILPYLLTDITTMELVLKRAARTITLCILEKVWPGEITPASNSVTVYLRSVHHSLLHILLILSFQPVFT